MNIRIPSAALAALYLIAGGLISTDAHAQVTANSFSSGGTAVSTASGRGNTRLRADSFATGGGYARSTMRGSGRNGGFASGNSTAIAAGGVAISNGSSHANGWGARSRADSTALSLGGFARSRSTARATGPWANARSGAISIADQGQFSNTRSTAIDDRRNFGFSPSSSGSFQQSFPRSRRNYPNW
jgi:hypothetical protein